MVQRRWRATAAAISVVGAASSALVTNIVTDQQSWAWIVALIVLVLLTVLSQVWLTVAEPNAGASEGNDGEVDDLPLRTAVPRQLPAITRQFVGRSPELDTLTDLLTEAEPNVGAVVISAVFGAAGIGKTTLAVHWAHQVKDRFPDGQLYINLRGFDALHEPMRPDEAMRGFLDAFEISPDRLPATFDAQAALYRSILSGKRALIILDNARDVAQVRPLLPGTATCFVLITSRNQLGGLVVSDGARPMTLDLLTHQECTGLLVRFLGADRVNAEPAAADELITYSGKLPLALAVIAARAMMYESISLQLLADELRGEPDLVEALDAGDPSTSVRAVFSWSYRALRPEVARVFRLLGLHPGPDIGIEAAAALSETSPVDAKAAIAALLRSHLMTEPAPRRYLLHDLVRVYAARRAETEEPVGECHAARLRLLDYYLHSGFSADHCIFPHRNPIDIGEPVAGSQPRVFTELEEASQWFTEEIAALIASSATAVASALPEHGWKIPWTFATFLHRQGRWLDYVASQQAALTSAERIGDPRDVARVRRSLGRSFTLTGRTAEAYEQYERSLATSVELNEPVQQALCFDALTWLDGRLLRHLDAIEHATRALDLYRGVDDVAGQARALNYLGWNHARIGNFDVALQHCTAAIQLFETIDNQVGLADVHDSLGYAYQQSRDSASAVEHYRESVQLWQLLGDRYNQADVLMRLGDTYCEAEDVASARVTWSQALSIFEEINHPEVTRAQERLESVAVG